MTKPFTFKITCNVQKRTDEHIFWLWLFYHSPVHQLPKFYTNIHFCALDLELLMLKANFEPYCCWNCLNCWICTYLFFGIFGNKPCDENILQDWVFSAKHYGYTTLEISIGCQIWNVCNIMIDNNLWCSFECCHIPDVPLWPKFPKFVHKLTKTMLQIDKTLHKNIRVLSIVTKERIL